jgi:RNA polymerase sigma-32 factor
MTSKLPILTNAPALPSLSGDYSLSHYINHIQKYPVLTATEEYEYANRWSTSRDELAAEMLITSHLRMVVAVAYKLKNYGIPVYDLIASGNLGLMQALQKFDPERGFRFSTYAMFWVKAEMYDMILSNWSMVKIGTSANQKRVFFNLSKAKRALGIIDSKTLDPDQAKQIAEYLDVPEHDVMTMAQRIGARDLSLNAPLRSDGDSADIMSNLEDYSELVEDKMERIQTKRIGVKLLRKHLADLPARDREILIARRLSDPVQTLEQLSVKYGVSRERIRQIEERSFAKLQNAMLKDSDNGQIKKV